MSFLGCGSLGADALRFRPNKSVDVRLMPSCPSGWRQKLHYLQFALWVSVSALRLRPSWIYASDPLSCPIALALSFLPAVNVVYHEHDCPTSQGGNLFQRIVQKARRRLSRRAKLNVLPNQARVDWFRKQTAAPNNVCAVLNCPSVEEVVPARTSYNNGDDFWVLYHGSLVPVRLPLTVLKALSMLPKSVKLRVIGYETIGYPGYSKVIQETAKELGIGDRVEVIGAVPLRSTLLDWCEKSDVGLALMPTRTDDINEQSMAGASNKPFDYLACGLSLLVSDRPDWNSMYVSTGYGRACNPDDPHSIAETLRWFMDNPDEMRSMGSRGQTKILAEWNYQAQFAPVLRRLKQEQCVVDFETAVAKS
jgi:glycosyltransferase involved in cell wall biosynthesis